jgi:hypothetical protein
MASNNLRTPTTLVEDFQWPTLQEIMEQQKLHKMHYKLPLQSENWILVKTVEYGFQPMVYRSGS